MWNHFLCNFNPDDPCTFHFKCTCHNCYFDALETNFKWIYSFYNYLGCMLAPVTSRPLVQFITIRIYCNCITSMYCCMYYKTLYNTIQCNILFVSVCANTIPGSLVTTYMHAQMNTFSIESTRFNPYFGSHN